MNQIGISEGTTIVLNSERIESRIVLVVPCYNEEFRWIDSYWNNICKIPYLNICFVNDGSKDKTSSKIIPLVTNSKHVLIELTENVGKAEAIRQGMNKILKTESPLGIGFLDADGAFPISDITKQIEIFLKFASTEGIPPRAVWSSRVQLAGRVIERDLLRHYLARILMTLLAIRLKFSVYDTQSGLKIFPNSLIFGKCLSKPFRTRWFVDLEIFLRYRNITGTDMEIWEEPLLGWRDVGGSKLKGRQYFAVLRDIYRLDSYLRDK